METKREKIGNVVMDYTYYPGEDFYSEGSDEDELLQIVKDNGPEEYNRIIGEKMRWSTLYHLSHLRGNIVDFIPIKKSENVLEVGAGCGAITGTLSRMAKSVTCIELSRKRSLINAYRNKEADNIEIKVGNFQDIEKHLDEKFDYIMLIGVLEYALSYINDPKPYDKFLSILSKHLMEGGKIVVAIENKYGMKYFAGCREDHTGRYFDSIMGYPNGGQARTFSRDELEKLAHDAGFKSRFFYPYPDYKLPIMVYSDSKLPTVGDFTDNLRNFDNERFTAFDEGLAFDESVRDGSFPFFSNSFLVIMNKDERLEGFSTRYPIYSKHSNERDYRFQIRTDIVEDGNHKRFVIKYPLSDQAVNHLEHTYEVYEALREEFKGTNFKPNSVVRRNNLDGSLNSLEFEYLDGITMAYELDMLRKRGRVEDVIGIMVKFAQTLRAIAEDKFEITEEFKTIFGVSEIPGEHTSMGTTDIDFVFSNLVYKDGWNVIDYEWTFDFPIPVNYVIYRSVRYYLESSADEDLTDVDFYERLGISPEEKEIYDLMEISLQRHIAGDRVSLIGFYSIFGRSNIKFEEAMSLARRLDRPEKVRLYYNYGQGFSEEDTEYVYAERNDDDHISFEATVPSDCSLLRIDPMNGSCMIRMLKLEINGKEPEKYFVNGLPMNGGLVFYETDDPQIMLDSVKSGDHIRLEYVISRPSDEFFKPLIEGITGLEAELKTAKESKKKGFLRKHAEETQEERYSGYTEIRLVSADEKM